MIFIMLTRLTGKQIHPEKHSIEQLKDEVESKIATQCPDVKWLANYALMGPHDYLDVFSADSIESAMRVSAIVRTSGHASTEIWPTLEWHQFKKIIASLPDENSFKNEKSKDRRKV